MSHSDVQKYICYEKSINGFNFSWTGPHKIWWIHYALCLEMAGRVSSVEL